MAIFREYTLKEQNRVVEDKRRHRQLVEGAIRKNMAGVIAEESLIGVYKAKKVKVPIRGMKEYTFIFGSNTSVGQGIGNEGRGERIGEGTYSVPKRAGNEEGEEIYETEITIEELMDYLFEELKLPSLVREKLSQTEVKKVFERKGIQPKGIPPRLEKKKTMIQRIKRRKASARDIGEAEKLVLKQQRFPLRQEDLCYHRMKEAPKHVANGVVICIMDASGSMDETKKYLARSFYFLLYQYIKQYYENMEIVFISHTTTAKEVKEKEFFHRGESGGTYMSSGYKKALEIIEKRFNPLHWNIYAFHCSDGDNWEEDNEATVTLARSLCQQCNLFGYGELRMGHYPTPILERFQKEVHHRNFAAVRITKKEDIWPALKKLLEKEVAIGHGELLNSTAPGVE